MDSDAFFTIVLMVCGGMLLLAPIAAIFEAPKTAKRKAEQEAAAYVLRTKTNAMGGNNNPFSVNEYQLRRDLRDYYGTAAYNGFPAASMDAMRVDNMSTQELVEQAQKNGFDMSKYKS